MISLWLSIAIGCSDTTATPVFPTSTLERESWLQTSRQMRYSFDANTEWQGWVLRTSSPQQVTIALFASNASPSSDQWSDCIRSQSAPPSLWLSATLKSLDITKRYASQLDETLPIVQVHC